MTTVTDARRGPGRPSSLTPERADALRRLWHATPPVTVGHMARVLRVSPAMIQGWRRALQLGDRRRFRRGPVPVLHRCEQCGGRISAEVVHHCRRTV